ncbi:MAG TPA: hypothetical protein VGO89_14155 [Streptomyces sp.]|jgi:hypothetical protein|nr:hypothetical protein [Streptomyces sp.]
MTAPTFFSPQWAGAVREALQAGPDDETRAGKLQEYWDFYQFVRSKYAGSWALGVRNLPAELGGGTGYLRIEWADGEVTDTRVVPAGEPVSATYVLDGEYADWKALYEGYDALRTVMYRKLVLQDGPLLEFFKTIYFFVECLAVLAAVATRFPENDR